jgi:hypothetical protein
MSNLKKVLIGLLLLFILPIVSLVTHELFFGIHDVVEKNEAYGFKIGSSKPEVMNDLTKLYKNGAVDRIEIGLFLRRTKLETARNIYEFFDSWNIRTESNIYRLSFENKHLIKINPNIDGIEIGMEKKDVFFNLESKRLDDLRFSFFDTIHLDDSLIPLSSDGWSIGYKSNNSVDFLSFKFKNDKLIRLYRSRHFIESM